VDFPGEDFSSPFFILGFPAMTDRDSTRTLRMVIEYDGTAYHGWQRQAEGLSIQEILEEKIAVMTGEPVSVIGSGRTDAGVHALNQVASFRTTSQIPPLGFLRGLNSLLPADIVVKAFDEAAPSFHARRDAKSKVYFYRIYNGLARPAIYRHYAWHIVKPLASDRMKQAAVHLTGQHDFTSFCSTHCDIDDHVRTIHHLLVEGPENGIVKISVEADGFLRYMVRIIAGTLVETGLGKFTADDLKEILAARDRRRAGMTAPPCGLFLKEVKY